MDLKQLVSDVSSFANRQSAIEFCVHALAAILLLSAELLSITAANSFAPIADGQSTIYLAMVQ